MSPFFFLVLKKKLAQSYGAREGNDFLRASKLRGKMVHLKIITLSRFITQINLQTLNITDDIHSVILKKLNYLLHNCIPLSHLLTFYILNCLLCILKYKNIFIKKCFVFIKCFLFDLSPPNFVICYFILSSDSF